MLIRRLARTTVEPTSRAAPPFSSIPGGASTRHVVLILECIELRGHRRAQVDRQFFQLEQPVDSVACIPDCRAIRAFGTRFTVNGGCASAVDLSSPTE